MGRLVWPLAFVVTFLVGWAAAGLAGKGLSIDRHPEDQQEAVTRLQSQIETLQARLRARDELTALRQPGAASPRSSGASAAVDERGFAREGRAAQAASAPHVERASAPSEARPAPANVQAALDRFYRYLETTANESGGRERWRQARELVDELRAMGPAAGVALMQVLSAGNDSDERRAAARLLGQLQVAQALPLLKDIIEKDNDLLLRRSAASGLRQLQTPESMPIMERMVTNPNEDRFVRLSAAVGLAESNRPLGVAGLTHIFDEATADGRGREMAFRALANLKDERPLPFMRQVATSQAEPGYRLQAIRYLGAQGDQQALSALNTLMHAPNEQPSIRDAAATAYAAIGGK
jgi:hypothetical protein